MSIVTVTLEVATIGCRATDPLLIEKNLSVLLFSVPSFFSFPLSFAAYELELSTHERASLCCNKKHLALSTACQSVPLCTDMPVTETLLCCAAGGFYQLQCLC